MDAVNEPIVIPKAVERESCEEKASWDALVIQRAIREKRITVKTLKAAKLFQKVRQDFGLGQGEGEAIALASTEKGAVLATDDRRAILACRLLKIPYTTAIGILIRMYQKGIMSKDAASVKLDALGKLGRYRRELLLDAKAKLEVR
ncbi:MAG: hypothetical protein HY208_04980 [Nitrospirae bacterium]|nr:hypothetical protein [Nitrospirota bacterium]